jgi:hypothetical protein
LFAAWLGIELEIGERVSARTSMFEPIRIASMTTTIATINRIE